MKPKLRQTVYCLDFGRLEGSLGDSFLDPLERSTIARVAVPERV